MCCLWHEKINFYKNKELHNFDISNDQFKMNKIINKFLLTADKFMPELNTNSQDLLTVLLNHLLNIVKEFKNLENDAAYSDSKNLAKRTISDKVLKDRTYEIARNF